jgi:hypothetical protein
VTAPSSEIYQVILDHLPIPPKQYKTKTQAIRGGKIVSSITREMTDFYTFLKYAWLTVPKPQRDAVKAWAEDPKASIQVTNFFCLPYPKLFTKDGRPKVTDCSNYLKALHDGLSKAIGVDDSRFSLGRGEHVILDKGKPRTIVILRQGFLQRESDLLGGLF